MKYYCPTASSMLDKPIEWGVITEYRRWGKKPIEEGRRWIADNGCFKDNWNKHKWLYWLFGMAEHIETCDFAVLPDVVGNHLKTMQLYGEFYQQVKDMGYRVAFVCQDGCVPQGIPPCNAIFIGGSTEWKMGLKARECISEGKRRQVWIHVGRINSAKRYAYFLLQGIDSFDGTSYCFAQKKVGKEIENYMKMEPLKLNYDVDNICPECGQKKEAT